MMPREAIWGRNAGHVSAVLERSHARVRLLHTARPRLELLFLAWMDDMETHELHRGRLIDHVQLVVKDLPARRLPSASDIASMVQG